MRGRVAGDELAPVDRVDAEDLVAACGAVLELTRGDEETVRHEAVLRIVREVLPFRLERVAEIRAGRVRRLRDGDAVVERQLPDVEPAGGELGQDPAIGDLVVENDR